MSGSPTRKPTAQCSPIFRQTFLYSVVAEVPQFERVYFGSFLCSCPQKDRDRSRSLCPFDRGSLTRTPSTAVACLVSRKTCSTLSFSILQFSPATWYDMPLDWPHCPRLLT